MAVNRTVLRPFVKWAGGKGQLLTALDWLLPPRFSAYHEPFLGGGAVFFHLRPSAAYLSDQNEELINTYRIVRDQVEELLISLGKHKNERDYYYSIRALDPQDLDRVERASRFIYLNKTCYNGLYRVNKQGRFNVPFGKYKNPRYADADNLRAASAALQHARVLEVADFSQTLKRAGAGDFIYFDPPYVPVSETARFTSYTADSFGLRDQIRLHHVFTQLDQMGCYVMLSNSDTPTIRELYRGFRCETVKAHRFINSNKHRRGHVTEVVVVNYES